jgi:hypothetical protein
LHDEFVVRAAGDVPYSFLELITKMSEALELSPNRGMQFVTDSDEVVLHYRLTFTARASGESVAMSMGDRGTRRVLQKSFGGRSSARGIADLERLIKCWH